MVKARDDIFDVQRYIYEHPDAPTEILDDAKSCLGRLKQAEMDVMEKYPSAYGYRRLRSLVDIGIVSVDELVARGLTTHDAFKKALDRDKFFYNNPIMDCMATEPDQDGGSDDVTDVFLLGMPSSGITCVLMGLLGSNKYEWNRNSNDSKYGDVLSAYRENCLLPGGTYHNMFAGIYGTVTDSRGGKHRVNLIDLSVVQFIDKYALRPEGELSLEDMVGSPAARLLRNGNRKILFIVIDPTVKEIQWNMPVRHNDDEGREYYDCIPCYLSQRHVIQRIMNILLDPANAEIMEKVDALHFIVTKWDVAERDGKNVNDAMANHMLSYNKACELCRGRRWRNVINKPTDFKPQIYTYSLGKFYVGGTFDFDPTDSDKLVDVITDAVSVAAKRRRRWYRRL